MRPTNQLSIGDSDPLWARAGSLVIRASLAVGIAAAATWLAVHRVSRVLHAHTDIVGSTTFSNFGVDYYFTAYYYAVLLFPAATIVLYVLFSWAARRIGLPSQMRPGSAGTRSDPGAEMPPFKAIAVAVSRLLATGAVLGLEVAIVRGATPTTFWRTELVTMLIYLATVLAAGAAWSATRGGTGFPHLELGRLNAVAAPLTLVGVLAVSGVTQLTVLRTNTVHHYPWIPTWLVILLILVAWAIILDGLKHARTVAAVQRIERRSLVIVVASIGLFLVLSQIPGELGPMEMFHDGEALVPGRLATLGLFPWKDIMFVHGLLQDQYRDLLGTQVFDNSRWGATAGFGLILYPLYAVSFYLLFSYLFGRNWPFLLLSLTLPLGPFLGPDHFRFVLWPLALLLFAATLEKASPGRMIGFGAVLFVQAVITPEAAFTLPACGAVVVLYEATHFQRDRGFPANFRRTIWCSVTGITLGVFLALYLASQHAFGDFLYYYHIAGLGRLYSGALPFTSQLLVSKHPRLDRFAALAPPAALVLTIWYVTARVFERRQLSTPEWVMSAAAIFVLLYYQKFLSRMDGHVYHVYAIAVPLLLYVLYRAVTYLEGWLSRLRRVATFMTATTRYPVSLLLLMVSLFSVTGTIPVRLGGVPAQYRAASATVPWHPLLGYAAPSAVDQALYSDVAQVMRAYLKPGDPVFDFANEPGLYHYLLKYRPATRYFEVANALGEDVQQDVIRRLRQTRPKLIVFSDDRLGLPSWDLVPNMVRHYEISQYILDNYRPLADVHGQLIFADAHADLPPASSLKLTLNQPLVTEGLYFGAQQCDWGYVPNFFSVKPRKVPGRNPVVLSTRATATGLTLSPPAGQHWSDFQWMEIDAPHFVQDTLTVTDRGQGGSRLITFRTLPASPSSYLVRVGSCTQWHGYGNGALELTGGQKQAITEVRLIP